MKTAAEFALLPKQTFLTENGQVGDCFRCCIAAIIGLPAEEVPHFLQENNGQSPDADAQRWLNARGWALILVPRATVHFPRWSADAFKGLPIIACGPTVRSKCVGQHHAVVTLGHDVVYDPHPSNAALLAVIESYLVVPIQK